MKVNTNLPNCILCLNEPADSPEHIIPQAIGGRLSAFILCTKCNNTLGSKLVNDIKKDPSIRFALQVLQKKIPKLVESMEEGQIYLGRDKNGNWIKHILKNSKYKVVEGRNKDGSIIKNTNNIKSYIAKKLIKEKVPEDSIKEKITSFEEAKNDEIIPISNDSKIVKRNIGEFIPSLKGPFINLRAVVLMAYEYLGLLIGELIYINDFDEIRNYILNNVESENVLVNRFIPKSRKYKTYHEIIPEFHNKKTTIIISFFGFIIFQVDFKILIPKVKDLVLIQDLENKRILFAESYSDAKQNKFFALN